MGGRQTIARFFTLYGVKVGVSLAVTWGVATCCLKIALFLWPGSSGPLVTAALWLMLVGLIAVDVAYIVVVKEQPSHLRWMVAGSMILLLVPTTIAAAVLLITGERFSITPLDAVALISTVATVACVLAPLIRFWLVKPKAPRKSADWFDIYKIYS